MNPSTKFKPFIYRMLLLTLLPLTACGPSQEQIAAQTATAQTAIAALWTPTATSTTTPTLTAAPTITLSPTPTQTPTLTPTLTVNSTPLDSFTIKDVTFSFTAPEGWESVSDERRVVFTGPTLEGTPLVLSFSLDQFTWVGTEPIDADETGIAMFSAHVQDTVTGMSNNIVQVGEDFLKTSNGEPYFRWVLEHQTNGKELHNAFYIFGTGKWFMTVMYGRPKSAGAEYDSIIDQAMQTLIFDE